MKAVSLMIATQHKTNQTLDDGVETERRYIKTLCTIFLYIFQ